MRISDNLKKVLYTDLILFVLLSLIATGMMLHRQTKYAIYEDPLQPVVWYHIFPGVFWLAAYFCLPAFIASLFFLSPRTDKIPLLATIVFSFVFVFIYVTLANEAGMEVIPFIIFSPIIGLFLLIIEGLVRWRLSKA